MELANNILAVVEPAIRPTEIKIDALAEEKPDEADYKQTSVIATLQPMILLMDISLSRLMLLYLS